MATSYGIKVIQDVAAEVEEILSALRGGYLKAGYGFAGQTREEGPSAGQEHLSADCRWMDTENDEGLGIDCVE